MSSLRLSTSPLSFVRVVLKLSQLLVAGLFKCGDLLLQGLAPGIGFVRL